VALCITEGVFERPYELRHKYVGFVDPSGGSGDSFTLAIAHKEGETSVIDVVRERKSPCEPPAVVEEFAHVLRRRNRFSNCMGLLTNRPSSRNRKSTVMRCRC
jgi:hypothetical protein